ncbi:MAG: redoxin domain-containing protein [Methanoregula sp.]|jgi:peroxiredoxin|nr:redoxin domain-containing protein [Methanoregula sp.]
MVQAPMVKPGDPARNFSIKDHEDKTFDLLEQSGKNVLLSFHPLAWTPFCAGQMKSLEDNFADLNDANTVAVGISVDSVPCKKAWADHLKIYNTRLLADFWPHGNVAEMYGIFRDANGFSERANILIDETMNVRFAKVYALHSLPDMGEVMDFIKKM